MIRLLKTSNMLVGAVVLLLMLSGCGSSSPELLHGTYATVFSDAGLQEAGLPSSLAGDWDITLDHDRSRFTIVKDGEVVVEGRHNVEEDQVVFTDERGSLACSIGEATGTYNWALDRNELTLTLVEDDCSGRKMILTTRPFSKRP